MITFHNLPYSRTILHADLEMDYNDYCGSDNTYHIEWLINRKFTEYTTYIKVNIPHHKYEAIIDISRLAETCWGKENFLKSGIFL